MPEETPGAGAPTTDQTQDTTQGAGAPGAPSTPPESTPDKPRADSANQLIKSFAKERGVSVEELLDQFKTYEDATKSEREKLESDLNRYKSEAEQARAELRDAAARSVTTDAATKAGAISPRAVYALIRDGIEYDKAGKPSNISELIESAKADEPQLFRAAAGSGDGGKGGSVPGGKNINDVFRQIAESAR